MSSDRPGDALMPIGQFAQLTRLTVKALRLYADRRLLDAAWVDPATGYRYYHASQVARGQAIRRLRDVGMPLDAIADVLASAPERGAALLTAHRDALLEQARAASDAASSVRDLIDGRSPLVAYDIITEDVAEQSVATVTVHTDIASIGEHMADGFGRVMQALAATGSSPAGMPLTIYHDVIDQDTPGMVEIGIPSSPDFPGDGDVHARTLPSVHAASVVHTGRYTDLHLAYQALSAWMLDNGFEPAGPPCEQYLNDPTEVGEAETRTKVVWPIRSAG